MTSDEEAFQNALAALIDAVNDDGKTVDLLPMTTYLHYGLLIAACLVQELNGIDGRLINLNTELHNITNLLKETHE